MARTVKALYTKFSGIMGLFAPFVILAVILYAISVASWFSWVDNALSDLGMVDPSAPIFNTNLMVGGGLLVIIAFSHFINSENKFQVVGATLLFEAGLALYCVGYFPGQHYLEHMIASFSFFAFVPSALVFLGVGFAIKREWWLAIPSFCLGTVAIAIWPWSWNGVAIPEFVSAVALSGWIVYTSICQVVSARGQNPEGRPRGKSQEGRDKREEM